MPQTVVVPLPHAAHDPERVAEAALPYARTLAARTGAHIVLAAAVDVLPTFDAAARSLVAPSATAKARWLKETKVRLDRFASELDAGTVETVVRWGNPIDTLLAVLADYPDPVLALASHARRGGMRLVAGSIAFQLVRAAPCPVLVVRGPQPMPPESPNLSKVVVPLDQSAFAEYALDTGLSALGPADLHVHLLHVVAPLPYSVMAAADLVAMVEPHARHYLQDVAQPLLARGYRVTTEVCYGQPATEIIRAASECGADLILMATHGRSGFSRLVFGSVAERVLQEARVPLLLVRPDEAALTVEAERTADDVVTRRVAATAPPAGRRQPVREVMSAPAVVAPLETPLTDIVRMMLTHQIGSVLVVDNRDQLVGIVTESDFSGDDPDIPLTAFQLKQLFGPSVSEDAITQVQQAGSALTASQIMTHPVVTVTESEPIGEVARLMLERGIERVPVVRDGVPVGIVARHDLLRLLLATGDTAREVARGSG